MVNHKLTNWTYVVHTARWYFSVYTYKFILSISVEAALHNFQKISKDGTYRSRCLRHFAGPDKGFAQQRSPARMCRNEARGEGRKQSC
jgi:hypothetical protein